MYWGRRGELLPMYFLKLYPTHYYEKLTKYIYSAFQVKIRGDSIIGTGSDIVYVYKLGGYTYMYNPIHAAHSTKCVDI